MASFWLRVPQVNESTAAAGFGLDGPTSHGPSVLDEHPVPFDDDGVECGLAIDADSAAHF